MKLSKQQKKKKSFKQQQKKKGELLQTYDRKTNKLDISLIGRTFGYWNMYKDLNHKKAMHVEEKLSDLERRASKVIHDVIIAGSQGKSQVTLFREGLEDLRKFLFIMSYRKPSRLSQFANKKFDPITWSMVENFIKENELESPQEVWLQNIREMLDTPYREVKDNMRIFSVDRFDFELCAIGNFLMILQAGENDEFIITDNGFGIFEGINGMMMGQIAFHTFYVISPKLVLVLCKSAFRKEIGFDSLQDLLGDYRSIFESIPHPPATVKYVVSNEDGLCLEFRGGDAYTFPFVKIPSAAVHLVNSFFLNEARPGLMMTFLSRPYLYKTIIHYYKSQKRLCGDQDFSALKMTLFVEFNKTHEEDLHLRKNFGADRTCGWNECVFGSQF